MKSLIVVGGGAAGFFCAINAARLNPQLRVTILEKQSKVLQKVKVSGGGRCNVTHQGKNLSELVKKYPRGKNFLKKTFAEFSNLDTIEWFQSRGVLLKTEIDGRIFPQSNTSQSIIDCLLHEASNYKVNLQLNTEVDCIHHNENKFSIYLKSQKHITADYLFLAPGGFAKTTQYHWIEKLGHNIETPVPSLFTFNIPDKNLHELMGLSVEDASVKIVGSKLQESGPVLITHWGLSGPAILRLSAWGARELNACNYHFSIQINWINQHENVLRENWNHIRSQQKTSTLGQKNPFGIQQRLWNYLIQFCGILPTTKWSELNAKEQNKLIHTLTAHTLEVKGKTTFKEEFVTCGGINLNEITPSTCESKLIKGLYFGGEILNVDGITGGFNFQHAWTSGFLAAKSIATNSIA